MTRKLFIWGSGGSGQLGLGNDEDYALPQEWTPRQEILLDTMTTGGCHTAARDSESRLYMWGDNEKLQLSVNAGVKSVVGPMQLPLSQITLVACGWSHSVAVAQKKASQEDADGATIEDDEQELLTWGAHHHNQLGRSSSPHHPGHVVIDGGLTRGRHVVSISCGWKHSMVVLADGSLHSWGTGRHGELGLGKEQLVAPHPTKINMVEPCDRVYCGWQHTIVHNTRTGGVYACGNNRHGQLGVPTTQETARYQFQRVEISSDTALHVRQVDVGWHYAVCLASDGRLYAWGKGTHGQLGLGAYETMQMPTALPFEGRVQALACGSEHTLVVTEDGGLYTCGWGEHGNLGHNDKENRSLLTRVAFFDDNQQKVESIVAGGAVSIAVARSVAE
ncbi:hypothetical protein Poli38472_005458 [Pythium oligandrum]|uniref:RCC1-like domain-containing protein n=1 Tax=Pythium oligandrum TaxID=41045 RepID=A0A8K1CHJ6_PYTOL|nr:hypothetical protein Poli38472_005458 [Pythium oligandrum]|eukprot:TMW62840.1 hypothetical protein Poli38472_005458 [Pythium oligandrum]